MAGSFTHILVDFVGVPVAQLQDQGLLGGLLIAAAGAAGFTVLGTPTSRAGQGAVTSVLLLDDSHIAVHAYPARGLLLLDAMCAPGHDARKVLEVFMRRIESRERHSVERSRG